MALGFRSPVLRDFGFLVLNILNFGVFRVFCWGTEAWCLYISGLEFMSFVDLRFICLWFMIDFMSFGVNVCEVYGFGKRSKQSQNQAL